MPLPRCSSLRFVHLDSVGSTQDKARALYRDGERGPVWIRADQQTRGRGRRDRRWVSDSGNLAATLLYPTQAEQSKAALYGFATSLAIADTLHHYRPQPEVTLKWPNDVLVAGAKISGLLIERETGTLLIGVGINLVSHPSDTLYPATHLLREMHEEDLTGSEPLFTGAAAALAMLAKSVSARFATFEAEGFEPVREAWLSRAHHFGKTVRVNDLTGDFVDLGPDGALCLRLADGTKTRVHAGDVSFG